MRYELRLILWVTAVAMLTLSVWRGFQPKPELPFEVMTVAVTNRFQEYSNPAEGLDQRKELWVGTLPAIDPGQRAMFAVDVTPPPEIITGGTDTRPDELPVLKG